MIPWLNYAATYHQKNAHDEETRKQVSMNDLMVPDVSVYSGHQTTCDKSWMERWECVHFDWASGMSGHCPTMMESSKEPALRWWFTRYEMNKMFQIEISKRKLFDEKVEYYVANHHSNVPITWWSHTCGTRMGRCTKTHQSADKSVLATKIHAKNLVVLKISTLLIKKVQSTNLSN